MYNNVAVTTTYTIPRSMLQDRSLEDLVYRAIGYFVIQQHPIMGVTVSGEGSPDPKWVRLPMIDLREVMKVVDADPNSNLDPYIQEANRGQFDRLGELPLWRLLLIYSPAAIASSKDMIAFTFGFFCHHAMGDGLSCAAFHHTFLEALNSPLPPNPQPLIVVPALPLLPTLEMGTPVPLTILYTIRKVFAALVYSPIDPLEWAGPLISRTATRPPLVNQRSFFLPSHSLAHLLALCRTEKTTLTALITVLVARKLALMFPTHSRFRCTVPFSMRKFTGHGLWDMGMLVSGLTTAFSSDAVVPAGYISCYTPLPSKSPKPLAVDPLLWSSARACKAAIVAQSSSATDQPVGLIKFVQKDMRGYFLGMLGGKRDHAFEVSNIGVVDGEVEGEGKGRVGFGRVLFSQGHSTYAPPYIVCLASAKGGEMGVSLTWEEGVVNDESAEGLLSWLETTLIELGMEEGKSF